MPSAHKRKKAPEAVRRRLLDKAIALAVEHGLSAVTVQSVSTAADVTKGGFLHHFPSKQALIDEIFDTVLTTLSDAIAERVAQDNVTFGAFTRAYVDVAFGGDTPAMGQTWIALSILMLDDTHLRQKWATWLHDELDHYGEDISDPDLTLVRLAVDGAWLAQHSFVRLPDRATLHTSLTARTFPQR